MAGRNRVRELVILFRNLFLAALLYMVIFGLVTIFINSGRVKGKLGIPALLDKTGPAELIRVTKSGVRVKFASTSKTVNINPHANVFNRPVSAVKAKDDYLGVRPHVDTEVDLRKIVEECRGSYDGIEKVGNVFDCLNFLSEKESSYYHIPEQSARASLQDPRKAEYENADGNGNTLSKYVSVSQAKRPSKTTIGTCSGPIIPYHTYWSGPATWRVEIFIKSYLFTQNLACSRLYIWLDNDHTPNAVHNMLNKDPLFARFLPFVERGDIVLKAWDFPSKFPLPSEQDNTDGLGYYKTPGRPNSNGEIPVADGLVRDENNQEWLILSSKQMTFLPQSVSDAVRFVVLHMHGGIYVDMAILMLRDMRPLLLPKEHSFAERWAAYSHPGDYNTAVMSLSANSSLSSYLLRGGVRMGLNFHPRVIGRMAWKDGRNHELLMLETATFDPISTEYNWEREGRCTVPCLRDYGAAFKGKASAIRDEWESYDGPQFQHLDISRVQSAELKTRNIEGDKSTKGQKLPSEGLDSFLATMDEEAELRKAGVVSEYWFEEDKFPPNNRTLQNFFRGAWSYHIHNQWLKHPEPSSWLSVLEQTHDGFFAGTRTNPYGEKWDGPSLMPYNFWPEFV